MRAPAQLGRVEHTTQHRELGVAADDGCAGTSTATRGSERGDRDLREAAPRPEATEELGEGVTVDEAVVTDEGVRAEAVMVETVEVEAVAAESAASAESAGEES